jgi:regulator of microtubule dynamics protein 3
VRPALFPAFFPALVALTIAQSAAGQTAAGELARGDSAYAAMDARGALEHFQRAAGLDTLSYAAAWKASRSAADLAVRAEGDSHRQSSLLREAERHARRAVLLQPNDAEGRFAVARALGLAARSVGVRERVRHANEVREHALLCLRDSPSHGGCLHVLGAWSHEVMRLSGVERFVARRLLGGRTFALASWSEAIRYLEAAVAADPTRIVHHTELAAVYAGAGRKADARRHYTTALQLPITDYNDPMYRERARAELQRLR